MPRAVVVLLILLVTVPAAHAAPPAPIPGTFRLARTVGDPAWALQTWKARPHGTGRRETLTCVQIGRLAARATTLVRYLGRDRRVLQLGDRSVCASTGRDQSFPFLPTILERLADDPVRPTRFTHTIVGGVARADATGVELVVRGRTRRLRMGRDRAWLAVLPGSVKRSQLVIRYRMGRRSASIDFATGRRRGEREFSPYVAGSTRRPLTVPSPTGGPPLALTRFSTRGDGDGDCVEPGRLIAGEAGQWSPEWGAFLDFPTLVELAGYTAGDWQPSAPTPQSTNGCADALGRGLDAIVARRVEPGLVAVGGLLQRGTRRLAIRRPDGRFAQLAVRDGAFLAGLPSTGALGERAVLELTDRRGRRTRVPLATGDQDLPEDEIDGAEPREDGAVLRVSWTGGFEPFSGVDTARVGSQLRVSVLARHPPAFAAEGTSYAVADIGISKCIDVVLPEPLGTAIPADRRGRTLPAGSGSGPPGPRLDARICTRVPAGFRDTELPLSTAPVPRSDDDPERDLGRPQRP